MSCLLQHQRALDAGKSSDQATDGFVGCMNQVLQRQQQRATVTCIGNGYYRTDAACRPGDEDHGIVNGMRVCSTKRKNFC